MNAVPDKPMDGFFLKTALFVIAYAFEQIAP